MTIERHEDNPEQLETDVSEELPIEQVPDEPATRDKRRYPRYTAPLQVEISGNTYETLDWSLSGFRIGDVKDLAIAGERVAVSVIIKISDFDFSFDATAELVRLNPTSREAAFRFTSLKPEQIRALSFVSGAFLSGRLKSVDGLLRTVSTGSGPSDNGSSGESSSTGRGRGWLRGLVFLLLAVMVCISARAAVLSLTSVDSVASWVDARQIELSVSDAAAIETMAVDAGSVLAPGDRIATLRNQSLELELVRVQSELDYLVARRDVLSDVRDGRTEALKREREIAFAAGARARVRRDEARESLSAAKAHAESLRSFAIPGEVSLTELTRAEQAVAEIAERLALAEDAVDAAEASRRAADSGFFVGDARSTGFEPATLNVEIVSLERQIEAKQVELDVLNAHMAEFELVSPCACVVREILLVAGERARAEEPVIALTPLDSRARVVAFVKHDQGRQLTINQTVTVDLADGRRDTQAKISDIRTVVSQENTEKLHDRDLSPERYTEIEITLSEGYSDAPASSVRVRVYAPMMQWLAHVLHL